MSAIYFAKRLIAMEDKLRQRALPFTIW